MTRAGKRLERKELVKEIVTSWYWLKSGEQKCLKAGYLAIRRRRQERAKMKNTGYDNWKKQKRLDIKTGGKDTVEENYYSSEFVITERLYIDV